MTIPTFTGLDTAMRGLLANQAAIDTTGHNIANANTLGYSRQSVDLTESTALTIPAFGNTTGSGVQIGTGVDVATISRIRDQFLDIQYRAQNTLDGHASQIATTLGNAQTALDEPSSNGISSQLSAFWSSWSALANNPSSASARQTVIDDAKTLSSSFNSLDSELSTIQSQASQQYASLTGTSGQLQSDANQVASLNQAISSSIQAGGTPNDLEDQRDKVLDDLSSLGTLSVTNNSDGTVDVQFGDAANPLVKGTAVNWPQTLTSAAGGQLGALLSLSSSTGQIGSYRTTLDNVASQVISSVNALQPSSAFFSGNSASTIAVSATTSSIQTSSTSAAGGNDLAIQLAALHGGSADQSYSAFVAQVGSDTSSAQTTSSNTQSLLTALDNQRQAVSGVSLDEEMTNLLTYQRGYQASARMMTTIDGMLDTLINHTGTVGL